MKRYSILILIASFLIIGSFVFPVFGQKKPAVKKPMIFAVLNDGKTIEPIAHVEKKKLTNPINGSDEVAKKKGFWRRLLQKGF